MIVTQGRVIVLSSIRNVFFLLLLLSCPVLGQDLTPGKIFVNSVPDGAVVTLSGDTRVSGVTPVRFDHILYGDYRLEISRYGFEEYKTRLLINPSLPMEISVNLKPKTRFKASLRSLLIPGWGQRYFDKNRRGNLLTAAAIVSAAGYFWIDREFDKKYERYEEYLKQYDDIASSGTLEELRAFQPVLEEAQQDAYDYENVRRAASGAVIGVWAINMIDILFFSAPQGGTFTIKGVAVTPSSIEGNPGITLSGSF